MHKVNILIAVFISICKAALDWSSFMIPIQQVELSIFGLFVIFEHYFEGLDVLYKGLIVLTKNLVIVFSYPVKSRLLDVEWILNLTKTLYYLSWLKNISGKVPNLM